MLGRRFRWVFILVVAAAALASATLFLLPSREAVPPSTEPVSTKHQPSVESSVDPVVFEPSRLVSGTEGTAFDGSVPAGGAQWEDRLDNILSSEADDQTIVRQLLEGLTSLPAEAQEEFIVHALNLCEDENYAQVESIYLASGTPPVVAEEIFDDSLNRSDEVKLPLLAKTMRNPAHPMAQEAREILEMYLDLDEGAMPPAGWEAAVTDYLAQENQE